jgi:hypothetical protein
LCDEMGPLGFELQPLGQKRFHHRLRLDKRYDDNE